MPRTLYIMTKSDQKETDDFLPYIQPQADQEHRQTSWVFTQEEPRDTTLVGENSYIIQEDTEDENVQPKKNQIHPLKYRELLGLIFTSDSIVVV